MSDIRDYIKFYGIWLDDWSTSWGGISYPRLLLRTWTTNALSEASSVWTVNGYKFLYPHHIKKQYYLEGVIEGEVTFGATAISHITNYRVTIYKHNTSTVETELATTGIITVTNTSIPALDSYSYHFWIDAYNAQELTEYDRLGVKVEWNIGGAASGATAKLYHDYSVSLGYDLWIDVPLILGD